jgi:hypothetical protein
VRRGIEALSRHQQQVSLAQLDPERRSTKPEVSRSNRERDATTGTWQRGRLRLLLVKQFPERTRWFESVCTHRSCRTWRVADICRRNQAAEDIGLQSRGRTAASVQVEPSGPASSAQRRRAAGLYPAGRPSKSVTRHPFTSPIAQMAERLAVNQEVRGLKPRRGARSFQIDLV